MVTTPDSTSPEASRSVLQAAPPAQDRAGDSGGGRYGSGFCAHGIPAGSCCIWCRDGKEPPAHGHDDRLIPADVRQARRDALRAEFRALADKLSTRRGR